MYQHILIPTDGSETSHKGAGAGLALAKTLGARVTILTVSEPLPVYADPIAGLGGSAGLALSLEEYSTVQGEHAAKVLKAAKAEADKAGVAADVLHVPNAQPADTILEVAKSHGCDLIAMASHGRRGLNRLLLGSQTADVVTRSPVPVLVLK
jgi:nucleotide-binding universal stress UspA family protein